MAAIEQNLSQLRRALETIEPAKASAEPVKASAKAAKASANAEPKEPRAPTAWNVLVQSTVADMRQNGWESWTDAKGTVWPASRRGPIKDKSGGQSEGFVYDGGENDGKSPSPALGGMLRASYIKSQSEPAPSAKAVEPSADKPKKAGRPPMTAEQKAEAAAKRAAAKAESGSESAAEQPKKAGRPPMTAEQKAAAAAKRAEKKAAKAAKDSASEAESVHTCSGVPDGWAELMGEKVVVKAKDLSFYPFVYEGKSLLMNDRGDVVDPEEGVWVGRLSNGLIDTTVEEPADIEEVVMRE